MSEAQFKTAFRRFMYADADRVYMKYPSFWNGKYPLVSVITKIVPGDSVDVHALSAYYRATARSKDPVRIFQIVARECIEQHGYGIDQSAYLAVWYFILVKLPEYDVRCKIHEYTDIVGMYHSYLNTGEIDYEHEW